MEWGWGVSASGVGGPDQWEMGYRREPADQFLLPSLDGLYRDAESSMPHLKTSLETKPSATVMQSCSPFGILSFFFLVPASLRLYPSSVKYQHMSFCFRWFSRPVVPNLFGNRDQFCGRQLFPRTMRE